MFITAVCVLFLYLFSFDSHCSLNSILVNAIKLMKEQKEPEHCFYIVKGHLPIPEAPLGF